MRSPQRYGRGRLREPAAKNFRPTENDLDHRVKWSPRAIEHLMIAGAGPPQVRPASIEPHGRSLFDRMRYRPRAARGTIC